MNNKIKGIALASFLAAGIGFNSCDLVKDLNYKVVQNPLVLKGDEVKLQITGEFIEKGLNKKAVVEITPVFVCKDGTEIPFDTKVFKGEKAAGNGEVVPKGGHKFSYSSTREYQPCMEEGQVIVRLLPKKGDKEKEVITTDPIADGTIITQLLVKFDDQVIAAQDQFVRTTSETTAATINYDKAKFNVKSSELKQQDIKDLEMFITDAQTNVRRDVKGINIQSYASPEGEVDKNNNLAEDRATSAETYLTNFYKKAKFEAAQVSKTPKGEDWDGFKTEVEKTTHPDKELILRVLEMTKDVNKREEDIRNMAKAYKFLEKDVLPQLRRSQMVVTYDKVGWSDDELKQLSKTKPDTLTVEELLYTGNLVEDLGEKLRIYKEAQRMYPNDFRTSNNVGYVLYMQNDLEGAKAAFEAANTAESNSTTLNNLGAVNHMMGDQDKAKELFAQAGTSAETNYNLGLIAITEGNYGEALEKMGSNQTFNVALAQVLNGDAASAPATIDASADADEAHSHYLKAVVAARANDAAGVVSNLKTAIAKDSMYKAKAARDAEFIKLRDNADFSALVK